MAEKPIMHGRDHRPGGTDPIPGIGGGGNAEWFYVNRSTTLSMSAATQDTIVWSSLICSDSSLFSLATDNHANDSVSVSRLGVLVVSSYLLPSSAGTDFVVGIANNLVGWGVMGENQNVPDAVWNRDGMPSGVVKFGPRDISIMMMSETPQLIVAQYHNYDSSSRNLTGAQMAGLWWPTSTAIS